MAEEPQLTARNQQRADALAKANRRRRERSELKQAVKSGEVDAIKLVGGQLPHLEELVEGWRLEQLLRLVPGIGSVTAQEIYEAGEFSPGQLVRSLSESRRATLASLCLQGQRFSPAGGRSS